MVGYNLLKNLVISITQYLKIVSIAHILDAHKLEGFLKLLHKGRAIKELFAYRTFVHFISKV